MKTFEEWIIEANKVFNNKYEYIKIFKNIINIIFLKLNVKHMVYLKKKYKIIYLNVKDVHYVQNHLN